jgi:hypothetical protein
MRVGVAIVILLLSNIIRILAIGKLQASIYLLVLGTITIRKGMKGRLAE